MAYPIKTAGAAGAVEGFTSVLIERLKAKRAEEAEARKEARVEAAAGRLSAQEERTTISREGREQGYKKAERDALNARKNYEQALENLAKFGVTLGAETGTLPGAGPTEAEVAGAPESLVEQFKSRLKIKEEQAKPAGARAGPDTPEELDVKVLGVIFDRATMSVGDYAKGEERVEQMKDTIKTLIPIAQQMGRLKGIVLEKSRAEQVNQLIDDALNQATADESRAVGKQLEGTLKPEEIETFKAKFKDKWGEDYVPNVWQRLGGVLAPGPAPVGGATDVIAARQARAAAEPAPTPFLERFRTARPESTRPRAK